MMTDDTQEPGFDDDATALGDQDDGGKDTLKDAAPSDEEQEQEMERVQEVAAEERKEGGYQ